MAINISAWMILFVNAKQRTSMFEKEISILVEILHCTRLLSGNIMCINNLFSLQLKTGTGSVLLHAEERNKTQRLSIFYFPGMLRVSAAGG